LRTLKELGQQKNRASGAVVVVKGLGCNGLAGWFKDYGK
jgi:hypothetical protein